MVDLDLTLFDYDALRRSATSAALSEMGFKNNKLTALHLVTDVLIPYGDALETAGLPNFRRKWNAGELFEILAGLPEHAAGGEFATALGRALEADKVHRGASPTRRVFQHRWHQRTVLQAGESGATIRTLKDMFNQGDGRRASIGKLAFDSFLQANGQPYPGARELLDRLRDRSFTTVILTEGDEAVQQGKIDILGLRSSVDTVFTTGACCGSEIILGSLWRMATKDSHHDSSFMDGSTLWAICRIYDAVYQYSVKSEHSYLKALNTLLLPENAWTGVYREWGFQSRWPSVRPPILVIGDRYDKDIYPAVRALGAIHTVRIRRGKYSNTWRDSRLKTSRKPAPWATVTSLWDVIQRIEAIGSAELGGVRFTPPTAVRPEMTRSVMRALAVVERKCGEEGRRIADALS